MDKRYSLCESFVNVQNVEKYDLFLVKKENLKKLLTFCEFFEIIVKVNIQDSSTYIIHHRANAL